MKYVAERVSVTIMKSNLSSHEAEAHRISQIAIEVAHEMILLSEFEKNLLLCLIEQFETLKPFDYPENFKEVKKELMKIQNNFSQYFDGLKRFPRD